MKSRAEHLRLLPRPIVRCPPEHLPEMQRAIAGRLAELAIAASCVSQAASELGDSGLATDLASIVERIRRHRARLLEDIT